MAYMRSLSSRSTILKRQYYPRFTYILLDDHHQKEKNQEQLNHSAKPAITPTNCFPQRSFYTAPTASFGSLLREPNHTHFAGACLVRHMSPPPTTSAAENIDVVMDMAAPAVNEVAIAAADSFLPVAVLQHAIDAVHNFTGFNWWASIVVTTLLIRSFTLPLLINQLKATSKLSIVRPQLEEVKQRVERQGMDPTAVSEGQKEMKKLFKEHGVSPFTPLKGLFIQAPVFISFFLAITNMAEKVPSFKSGGAFWFVDLTTADDLYIFPVLTALTFLITVECNTQEGMEGNPAAGTMKNVSRALAAASVPLTMSFPKAIFCYWITSNLFSLTYGLVLKAPGVKEFLGVPKVPVAPPTTAAKSSSFDLFSAIKQLSTARKEPTLSLPIEPPKLFEHKKSSSSVITKRIRSLEKEVKGRKKNKKR
ncbi:PREDICTED: mitochondrial inner membrane protein OXA1-like isoform X2 [Populus euphratica]|uniref:Mitochondrial inner membrane protein OXA1-like isoform X1 n=1 Tax=Populus euphratica TaxID=75702 RepID=A0AAJ6XGH7_POPEU|nr:PREDICTED: mitochondrial inner membrane protein OXA1-like isoform X1 [Populus euphratica]XP_011017709.1 PREDICTED: mitochondrial inner membrane protein OXA1-like isoform X2 [Populus euphratica]